MQTLPILRFFEYAHLPTRLQEISQPFCELAQQVAQRGQKNADTPGSMAETVTSLRKLLEAKDAAVRAAL
jgi:hypothetical protein